MKNKSQRELICHHGPSQKMAEVRFKNEEGIIHIDWGGALAVVWWQEEC